MRILYRKVPVKLEKSFNVRRDVQPNLSGSGHYHPELELHYVLRGKGIRFVGDTRSEFSAGEMVLIGPNLPHSWRSAHDDSDAENQTDVIVVNFVPEFLGKQFLQLPEAININRLLERSSLGLEFYGSARERVAELLMPLIGAHGFDRVIYFLQILNVLALTTECRSIAKGKNMLFQHNHSDVKRLTIITEYSLSNYKREISLEEIANAVNLSVTSFCRYFKVMTTKTYLDFLIELRVSSACKLLLENKMPTDAICFECGFRNISNFYRHFRRVMGMTPQEYRRKCLG